MDINKSAGMIIQTKVVMCNKATAMSKVGIWVHHCEIGPKTPWLTLVTSWKATYIEVSESETEWVASV